MRRDENRKKFTIKKSLDTKTIYSTKAEKYAKYRWDYAPGATKAIIEITRMSARPIVADIGASI